LHELRRREKENVTKLVGNSTTPALRGKISAPFGCNYKPAEKYCWLIFYERKILFWLKKPAE
jgi:hypothetical protein